MHILLIILAFAAIALLAHFLTGSAGNHSINVCNSAGDHDGGRVRRVAETAFTLPHLLASKGTTAGTQVIPCPATGGEPLGSGLDEAALGEGIAIEMGFGKTRIGVAAAAIAADVRVYTGGSGKLTSTGGTGKFLVGRSVSAAGADGDEFEYLPCFPVVQS